MALGLCLLLLCPALAQVSAEREEAVMAFVKEHHPALAELLVQLKTGSPKEYEQAMRELFRTSERLAQIQERDPQQHKLEIKLWQAQSRVQLLTARLKMSDSQELREQLRAALNEQLDMRLALLRLERDRVSDRLNDIDRQVQKLQSNRQDLVDRQMESLAGAEKTGASKPNKGKEK
jgi:L-2-hydroxyglutarate oxidase LhgO